MEVMERLTTLKSPQRRIEIQVFEGPGNASLLFNRTGVPMKLSATCRVPTVNADTHLHCVAVD
jgi:hypothetical protein